MPTGSQHHSTSIVKLLLLGDAKTGKTTALASLVAAGYKLRILDTDNLLDPLIYKVRSIAPDKLDNIDYITVRDKYINSPGGVKIDGKAVAWTRSLELLNHWKYTNEDGTITDLGPPSSWPDDCILVIDSLSRLCDSAFDFWEGLTPRGKNSGESDGRAVYGNAQKDVEKQLAALTSKRLNTNLIVICHGIYMDLDNGTKKIFPQGVGQKLSPIIPTYFPNFVRFVNRNGKRTIQYISDTMIDLAIAAPDSMPKDLDTETGLATIFSILRNQPQEPATSPAATPAPGPKPTSTAIPSLLRRTAP